MGEDIVNCIKAQRIKGWGHLKRMGGIKLRQEIIFCSPIRVRIERRPKNKWRDEVINDLEKLN